MPSTGARTPLSESASREILARYGVPVIPGRLAADSDEAAEIASSFGFPVVLKGHGAALAHKTELGLVKLGVGSAGEARAVAAGFFAKAPAGMDGVLVSPQAAGRREFIAGMFRDPLFGPVVMFGLGGVLAEALGDVVFRLAPLCRADALEMIGEIRAGELLGPFRGEEAVDLDLLADALVGLSRLADENPAILEVDINPLLVGSDGRAKAVDALVVEGVAPPPCPARPRIPTAELARFFHPRSVAFIGASHGFGKWGQTLPVNLIAGGFPGPIYLVNPKGGTLWGRPVSKSVAEIPGPVDLCVVTVPAKAVPGLLPELAAKGVRHVLLITSGFAETGGEGCELERRLVEEAARLGILLFGPNTMGILNPHMKLYLTGAHVRVIAGDTALVSQSGNMGVQLLEFAASQGIGVRAFAGSGNEAMVTVEDFMEGFEVDELTRTVLFYIESVKDGRRFYESARRVGRKKPVILLKGGRTAAGSRAAESHTGAMAADHKVFDAMCRQAGIISVEKPAEMLDASAAFSSLPLPAGNRVAIMTLGGGWGVVTSDLCAEIGLLMPPLDAEVKARFDAILPPYWSHTNPVDLVGENDPELPIRAIEILSAWEGCDAILNLGVFGRSHLLETLVDSVTAVDPDFTAAEGQALRAFGEATEKSYIEAITRAMEKYKKPIIGVNLVSGRNSRTLYEVAGSPYKAVFFNSPERAVRSLYHMCKYGEFLSR